MTMRYYRVRSGYVADDQAAMSPGAEADIWPAGRNRPFVLVARKSWQPPTDIYETPGEVVIKMELAGMQESGLDITIHDDLLVIRGRRADETARRKIGYHHMGISYGEFASEVRLPGPIDQERVSADYDAGFLTVSLPKLPARSIGGSIRVSGEE
jgi:HSP20 family protein